MNHQNWFWKNSKFQKILSKILKEKNSEPLKIGIWKNPTDKSLILSIPNFCQLHFLISSFLRTVNFFSSFPDFFHEFWYILYLVPFYYLWLRWLKKIALIFREGCYASSKIRVWHSCNTYIAAYKILYIRYCC